MIRTANVQEPYSPAAFPSLQALYSPGPLGPFTVSTLPPAFRLFYHSGFENGSPRPIFRFGNLFHLRGTAPDTASAPRLLPPEKAKAPPEPRENVKAPANRTARAVPGRGTVPAALDKEAARAPGREEEPDRAGQPDNTAQAKNGLVPAGDQAVPGGIQQKMLVFL